MENINIVELLKDCPKGMELDCSICNGVKFIELDRSPNFPIVVRANNGYEFSLTKYGQVHNIADAKCVIFPKGKTTWEGFQRPFEDGDVVIYKYENGLVSMILNKFVNFVEVHYYCALYNNAKGFITNNYIVGEPKYTRFATEEEKQILFDAIKANGYQWNPETKILEKLTEPTEDKGNISDGYHTFNELYEYRLLYNASMFNELAKQGLYDVHKSKLHSDGTIPFGDENWFIVQAELPTGQISNHYEMKDWGLFNVPEKEKANQYDGHTPQDVAKRLRNFLTLKKLVVPKFKVGDKIRHKTYTRQVNAVTEIRDTHYILDDEMSLIFRSQDDYELVPNKFDIANLKPFDKVLVRGNVGQRWTIDFFSFMDNNKGYPFVCVGHYVTQCIPYEGNEHLLGTSNDCVEYYKLW